MERNVDGTHSSRLKTIRSRAVSVAAAALVFTLALTVAPARSQDIGQTPNYIVGSQDVLTITCYDQNDLSGKFTVETDGTFTYPMIGRVKAGGLTLRAVEDELKRRLISEGFF